MRLKINKMEHFHYRNKGQIGHFFMNFHYARYENVKKSVPQILKMKPQTILSKFQIFTIYSAASIITLLSVVGKYGGSITGQATGVVISTIAIFALANALGYYIWDIVKSAYKQIKEENENAQPAGNYTMNTYEKSEPAQYNHNV